MQFQSIFAINAQSHQIDIILAWSV